LGKAYTYLRYGGFISRGDDKGWKGVSGSTVRAHDKDSD